MKSPIFVKNRIKTHYYIKKNYLRNAVEDFSLNFLKTVYYLVKVLYLCNIEQRVL